MDKDALVRTIDEFVAVVRDDLRRLRARERDDALAELESLLRSDAARAGESAAVTALGDPHAYAASIREALGDVGRDDPALPQGHVLGMPYDFRGASIERLSSRVWNPADPRVLMPRLFGLGWTVNLGAVAVKLGLIRPDDMGEESYERIPGPAVAVVVAIPQLLAVAAVAIVATAWVSLPAEVPIHWGATGSPDDWAPKLPALGALLVLTVVPALVAGARALRRDASARVRLLSSVAAALLALIGLGVIVMTVADADGGSSGAYAWLGVLAALVVPFMMLYVPMRLGLRAEWRDARDENERSC